MNDHSKDEPQDDSTAMEESVSKTDVTAAAAPETKSAGTSAPTSEPKPAPAGQPTRRPSSWPGFVGLFVALLAAAGVGYLWKEQQTQQSLNAQFSDTQREVTVRGTALGRVSGDIETLVSKDLTLDSDLAALTQRIERQLEELPARMTRLEGTLDKIPGVAGQARSAWLLAEAEYFLRIANAQLNLAGNVDVSLRALELADAKIKDLADPGLTRVRAKISDERTALKAVPRPDAEGIILELGSLAQTLHTLPFSRTAPGHFTTDSGTTDETGWRRAWRVTVDALSSIVSVRRNDEAVVPLMSATEESMLIRSLDIELQIARLAVIRNKGNLYRQSLQSVEDRLATYFDGNSRPVKAAVATVSRLADTELPEQLPDISGSLGLLLTLGDEAAAP